MRFSRYDEDSSALQLSVSIQLFGFFEPSKRYMREDKALRRILRFPVHDRFCILFDADSVPAFARTDRPGITAASLSLCLSP